MKKGVDKRGKIISISLFVIFSLFCIFLIFFIPSTRSWMGSGAGPYNCSGCADCTAAIGNASAGAIIYLNATLSGVSGTCINFGNKSNVIFDCQNSTLGGNNSAADYGINLTLVNNNTVRNCNNISQFYYGIWLQGSNNSRLINITANYNTQGIRFQSGSNNNYLANITTNNNTQIGTYIYFGSNNTLINITSSFNSLYGVVLSGATNNTLNNITANNNSQDGFFIQFSSGNLLSNITAIDNSFYDIFYYSPLIYSSDCNNQFSNVTISGNYPFRYSNSSVVLQNQTLSELILCNSSNSNINNITIISSANIRNNGIIVIGTNNTIFSNINSSNAYTGMNFGSSYNNTLTNVITNNNVQTGIAFPTTSDVNNNILTNVTANFNVYGIDIEQSSNNIFRNITANSNSLYGIYLVMSLNNTLNNIIANSNVYGITFNTASNNTISNALTNGCGGAGIYLVTAANNNILTNITANLNLNNGIYIGASSNNTIINVTANNNTISGISLAASSNNTIINVTAKSNMYGVSLVSVSFNSTNNTLIGINANNNSNFGIAFNGGSSYNTIRNSFIQYNGLSGIFINSSVGIPQYNQFYNNYFNNSAQSSNLSTIPINFFNTTKTLGTNIVGGAYLGGNYWAAPNGTGFSQTCTSSTDGICNIAYSLDGINYDYLPLICIESWSCGVWGTCSGSIQTRICTDANFCQTYKYQPITSQSCTSGTLPPTSPSTETFSVVSPSQPAVMIINNSKIDLTKITVNVNTTISNASLTVTPLSNTTGADLRVSLRRGALYQAYQITTIINNSDITNVTINFKVNATWLTNQNGTTSNIRLYRYYNNGWTSLPTTYTSKDSLYYYFSAISPGFSTFVVFFGEYDCNPNEIRCFNNEVQLCLGNSTWLVTEQCSYKCSNGKCVNASFNLNPNIIYAGAIIGIVAAIIVIFLILRRRISKGSSSRNTYSKFYQNQFIHKT